MSTYRLISSDSHIFEPPDLWEKWIEPKYRDRAPYVKSEEETDQWYVDQDIPFGSFNNAAAGVRFEHPELLTFKGRYEEVRLGGFEPDAHIKDMELDGVSGGVLYPSAGLTIWNVPDSDLLSACFQAYNNWLGDVWCKPYPHLLKGIAMVNLDDIGEGVRELERVAKMGLVGAMIALRPMNLRYNHPDYEPLWAAAQDLEIPLSLHTGSHRWQPQETQVITQQQGDATAATNREIHTRNAIADMIFSGVFERYPKLMVGAVEFEIAWAPYFMGRMDDTYIQRIPGQSIQRFKGGLLPSDLFRRNIFIGFQEDDIGIELRNHIGVEVLQWGSDYPHSESTFPRSREIVERILRGVPEEDKAMIAGGNAARLYKFN